MPLQCLWRDSVTLISTLLLTYLLVINSPLALPLQKAITRSIPWAVGWSSKVYIRYFIRGKKCKMWKLGNYLKSMSYKKVDRGEELPDLGIQHSVNGISLQCIPRAVGWLEYSTWLTTSVSRFWGGKWPRLKIFENSFRKSQRRHQFTWIGQIRQ